MRYEYRCTACGITAEFDRPDPPRGHVTDQVETQCNCACHTGHTKHVVACCHPGRPIPCLGQWKRIWSFSIGSGVRS